ncbi:MAG: glycogen debranching enzyme family protein [Deltaproteobacteria bacterium]|nr:glycogen debranching enzyme family protein [Deltaproteobacteria bacterium]MBK8235129.1 glycogen debranching enzyme family protein [Deltaproteobacteria bacterium]MBP7289469.1 glycogen debranching enzyme family protein [Nannocystaceae bacterium]
MRTVIDRALLHLEPGQHQPARDIGGVEAATCEWLEADGLGGFASGTVLGVRTRRYHAALLVAAQPPTDRFVLVQGLEAWLETDTGVYALSSNLYDGEVVHPDGVAHLREFRHDPWPQWRYDLPDGTRIVAELFVPRGLAMVACSWTREGGRGTAFLRVRPMLGPRDPHGLHVMNDDLVEGVAMRDRRVIWRPYEGVPAIEALCSGTYEHAPEWFRRVLYLEERARGLPDREDVFSPGEFTFELGNERAELLLGTTAAMDGLAGEPSAKAAAAQLRTRELERRKHALLRARDAYVVRRGEGASIIAGYPWFGEWGRDTFMAMRGLCIATGALDEAAGMIDAWVAEVSEGMVPNRLAERGSTPEYNSVDASLWFGIVVCELVAAFAKAARPLEDARQRAWLSAVDAIIDGFTAGTRHGIRVDDDGLVAAGEPGLQVTWMDAKVDDWVVTPRIGKPVEVQALWCNLLALASVHRPELAARCELARASFGKFVNDERGILFDVIDVDHQAGRTDGSFRPNQIYAVGGLPRAVVDGAVARRIVDAIERELLTPIGLRSLAPGDHGYAPRYLGGIRERDGAYHQGTVWPHLMGAFVDAWLRVHGRTRSSISEARERFLAPLREHLGHAGLGHVSEIADAEAPHTPRGAPFQAWGLGELIRIEALLADDA